MRLRIFIDGYFQGPFGSSGSNAAANAQTQSFNQGGGFGGFGGSSSGASANAQTFNQQSGFGGASGSGASAGASAQTVDIAA